MATNIKVMISEEEIREKISEMGKKLSAEYRGESVVIVTILKGGVFFAVDLARALDIPVEMDFMRVSSYGSGTTSSGNVQILMDLKGDIQGKHVILAEDIVDTGITLSKLIPMLKAKEPASLKLVTLLDKPAGRKVDLDPDMCAFTIPDAFVVGYGLDYDEKYRNLPYVGVVEF